MFSNKIFLGKDIESEPKYHFGFRGRADECYDSSRVMRGKRYSYHKNYAPFVPNGQFLPYMHYMIATPAWNKLHKEGKTNAVTGRFFRPRPSEEFYDNEVDFDNVNNLIDAPEHQEKIAELRAAMRAETVGVRARARRRRPRWRRARRTTTLPLSARSRARRVARARPGRTPPAWSRSRSGTPRC